LRDISHNSITQFIAKDFLGLHVLWSGVSKLKYFKKHFNFFHNKIDFLYINKHKYHKYKMAAYIAQLTPMEQKILKIAASHLETSFSLCKSIGYQEWQAQQQKEQQKEQKEQKEQAEQQAQQAQAQQAQAEQPKEQPQEQQKEQAKPQEKIIIMVKRKLKPTPH
jgi:FtsZ-interacting cell division protein YlmF